MFKFTVLLAVALLVSSVIATENIESQAAASAGKRSNRVQLLSQAVKSRFSTAVANDNQVEQNLLKQAFVPIQRVNTLSGRVQSWQPQAQQVVQPIQQRQVQPAVNLIVPGSSSQFVQPQMPQQQVRQVPGGVQIIVPGAQQNNQQFSVPSQQQQVIVPSFQPQQQQIVSGVPTPTEQAQLNQQVQQQQQQIQQQQMLEQQQQLRDQQALQQQEEQQRLKNQQQVALEQQQRMLDMQEAQRQQQQPIVQTQQPIVQTQQPIVQTQQPIVQTQQPIVQQPTDLQQQQLMQQQMQQQQINQQAQLQAQQQQLRDQQLIQQQQQQLLQRQAQINQQQQGVQLPQIQAPVQTVVQPPVQTVVQQPVQMIQQTPGNFAGRVPALGGVIGANPADLCLNAQPGDLIPHPTVVSQFVICYGFGEFTVMDCPEHLVYNQFSQRCDLSTERPLGCASNPCLNQGVCRDINQMGDFACQCQPGFTGAQCERLDACSSNPCGAGNQCVSLGAGAPVPNVCVCQGGQSFGQTCQRTEPNPCLQPGSSLRMFSATLSPSLFAHCEGTRPHFLFCQQPLIFNAARQSCDWPARK